MLEKELLARGIEPNHREADRLVANMREAMSHPWACIERGWVFTLDGIDLRSPIKQFPKAEYLRYATDLWVKERLLALPKSRRMIMSWMAVWWHLWLAMFHEGASVYFQSETEKKSDELIERAEFIRSHLPKGELILPRLKAGKKTYCSMVWPGIYSQILGVAQGANQLRGPTATALLLDEVAFWPEARASIVAAKPTIEGGGRCTLISSANPSFFREICFDTSG